MDQAQVELLLRGIESAAQMIRAELFGGPQQVTLKPGANLNEEIKKLNATGGVLVLEPGFYPGNITLEPRDVIKIIEIRSSVTFKIDTRVTKNDAANMPIIQSLTVDPVVKGKNGSGGMIFRNVGFSFVNTGFDRTIVELGDDAVHMPTRKDVPSRFYFDGCLFLGHLTKGGHRGLLCNSSQTTVINCGFYDLFEFGRDSQAICGFNGTEGIWIENCYLEGGAENVIFGGSDSASLEMSPKNVKVIGCHLIKQRAWLDVPNGSNINIKALFELKNCENFYMNGCLLENNWAKNWSSGVGMTLKSCNQANEPWARMNHVLVENCVIRNVGSPFNVIGQNDSGLPSTRADDVVMRNILAYNIGKDPYLGDGRGMLVTNPPHNWTVENCTFLGANNCIMAIAYDSDAVPRATAFNFNRNVMWHGEYGIFTSFGLGTAALNYAFAVGYSFIGNMLRRNNVRQNSLPVTNLIIPETAFDSALTSSFEYTAQPSAGINYATLIAAMKDKL